MHQVMLLNPSAVPSPARWHLRVLVLLLGITIVHIWAGPALSDTSGASLRSATGTTITEQVPASPAVLMAADVLHQAPSPSLGLDIGQDALVGDVCAAACPDGHLVATTLCSMVLVTAGLMGLYCLRPMVFLPDGSRTHELRPAALAPQITRDVSLLQLSISRI